MRPQRKSQAVHCALGACTRLAALFVLLLSGCGVRVNPHLAPSPLPLNDGACAECTPTGNRNAQAAAPGWLVRCRRDWERWRRGEGVPVVHDTLILPPAPRFHPVPTRPVFSPQPWEEPAAKQIDPSEPQPLPAHPTTPPEEIPPPEVEMPESPPPPVGVQSAPKSPPSAAESNFAKGESPSVKLTAPRTSRRAVPSSRRDELSLPEAPRATAPLPETPLPQWRPRR